MARAPSVSAAEVAAGVLGDIRREWQYDTEKLLETAIVSIMAELEVTALRISTDRIVEHCMRYRAVREFLPDGMYEVKLVERNLDNRQSDLPIGEQHAKEA